MSSDINELCRDESEGLNTCKIITNNYNMHAGSGCDDSQVKTQIDLLSCVCLVTSRIGGRLRNNVRGLLIWCVG